MFSATFLHVISYKICTVTGVPGFHGLACVFLYGLLELQFNNFFFVFECANQLSLHEMTFKCQTNVIKFLNWLTKFYCRLIKLLNSGFICIFF